MRIAILVAITVLGFACGGIKNPGSEGDKCETVKKVGQRMTHTCGRGLVCHPSRNKCVKDSLFYDTSR